MCTFETFPCLNWNNWFNAAKNGSIFEVDAETQRNFCVAVCSWGENLGIKYHNTRIGTRCQLLKKKKNCNNKTCTLVWNWYKTIKTIESTSAHCVFWNIYRSLGLCLATASCRFYVVDCLLGLALCQKTEYWFLSFLPFFRFFGRKKRKVRFSIMGERGFLFFGWHYLRHKRIYQPRWKLLWTNRLRYAEGHAS